MENNNRLIAEFMGHERYAFNDTDGFGMEVSKQGFSINLQLVSDDELKYNTSWDWLMPVVEKIEKVNHVYFDIYREATIARYQPQETTLWKAKCNDENDKINHVYNAVLMYIEFYNSQNA